MGKMYKVSKITQTKTGRIIEQFYVGNNSEKAKKALKELHCRHVENVEFVNGDDVTTYQHVNNGYYGIIKSK